MLPSAALGAGAKATAGHSAARCPWSSIWAWHGKSARWGRAGASEERAPDSGSQRARRGRDICEDVTIFFARRRARSPCPLWARRAHGITPLKRLPLKRRCHPPPNAVGASALLSLETERRQHDRHRECGEGKAAARERSDRGGAPPRRGLAAVGTRRTARQGKAAAASDSERGVCGAERVSGREDALRAPQRERTSGAEGRPPTAAPRDADKGSGRDRTNC